MGENTKIEWCDHSWSPWRGCTKVSPGCANCYAETLSKRFPVVFGQWGKGKPRVKAKNWNDPVKWNRTNKDGFTVSDPPITVFPSLCDWLDEEVPIEWLAEFLRLVHDTPNLTWLLLTKRPENWHSRLVDVRLRLAHMAIAEADNAKKHKALNAWLELWRSGDSPPSNVWVGTSVEDQTRADERIPAMLEIPATGRFLSVEPLLGQVDLNRWLLAEHGRRQIGAPPGISWVICGGESGHGARPCNVEWVRSLVRQCKSAGVATFVKQLGASPVIVPQGYDPIDGTLPRPHPLFSVTHTKGGDPDEWPEDLRVREFPQRFGKEASRATA
ncbi:MAG: DUF5131 family protein [Arthrobacter sp.]|nr:DUF5131 family protein [Arthrobacter sp.]